MKLSSTKLLSGRRPVFVAATLLLASASAHAQLATPGYGTATPAVGTLFVSVFDTSSKVSELVSLSYNISALTPATAGGPLTPNGATTPYVLTSDPTGGSGQVLQLNFGVIPSFATTFTTVGSTTDYMVLANTATTNLLFTDSSATNAATLTGLGTVGANASGLATAFFNANLGGTAIDTTGTATYNANGANGNGGTLGVTGFNAAGAVGTALNFFSSAQANSRTAISTTQYASTAGAGFWYLSSTGDLTWNVPSTAAAVPLPAAAWLFVSGIAGLGAIGRRRRQTA